MDKPVEAWNLGVALDTRIHALKHGDQVSDDGGSSAPFHKIQLVYRMRLCLIVVFLSLVVALISFGRPFLASNGVVEISVVLAGFWLWRVFWTILTTRRARKYCNEIWSELRHRAERVWSHGWRPVRLHIQVTACFDSPEVTARVIHELVNQLSRESIAATVYYGTTSAYDEAILNTVFDEAVSGIEGLDLDLVFIRLEQIGHYVSTGKVLREMRRWGALPDDLIIFLDDDTVLGPDLLKKTLPLFCVEQDLQIVATDQQPICFGPGWIENWLHLRFAQRRLELCAQALSGRFLPYSGRIRILRAGLVLDEAFILSQEAHQRGLEQASRFRRLSVSDSITWCHLLKRQGRMIFVPDAQVYSVSLLQDADWRRVALHLRRWSGQAMRRAAQVILLGPTAVSLFVWLRVVDMRLTALVAVLVPFVLFTGEMMMAGFAAFWIVLIFLTRIMAAGPLLQQGRTPWILIPYVCCVTPLIHGSVVCVSWGLRVGKYLSRQMATGEAVGRWGFPMCRARSLAPKDHRPEAPLGNASTTAPPNIRGANAEPSNTRPSNTEP